MDNKKVTKADIRRMEAEKKSKRNRIIFTLFCILVVVLMIVAIALTIDKNQNTEPETNGDNNSMFSAPVDKSDKYSAGLTEEGKIQGIDNINDYVTLNDVSLTAYSDDYEEVVNPMGKVTEDVAFQVGTHMLENIEFYADVNVYSDYYNVMKELYMFIYNDQFEAYSEIYKESQMEHWDTLYEFLGVTETEYYKIVDNNSLNDAKHYMVVQALVEKYGITCTRDDINNYCMYVDSSVVGETEINNLIYEYGMPYMVQRTLEWKLIYVLADKTEMLDGSVIDGALDNSDIYSAVYYDNGKIRGVGDLTSYITISNYEQMAASYEDSETFLNAIINDSQISVYADYLDTKETQLKKDAVLVEGDSTDYKAEAEKNFYRDITVQKIFSDQGLKLEDYEDAYCKEMDLNPDKLTVYLYTNGDACYNRNVMEFAVLSYLNDLIQNN
ncbi:MAG: hypothetical protein ACI39R_02595 [Lachnospiraceae bacterium]